MRDWLISEHDFARWKCRLQVMNHHFPHVCWFWRLGQLLYCLAWVCAADYLSSCFESIAQWESGAMEFAAVCSFIPEVSENEETWRARNAELVRLVEFQTKKSGMLNYRLCMHPFCGRHEQTEESAVCLTSGALICKTTLVLDGNHGWSMSFSDNCWISLSALIKDLWFAASPVVYLNPISEILCGVKWVRLTMEPAAFWSKRSRVMVYKHMVDGALVGPDDVTRKWTTMLSQKKKHWKEEIYSVMDSADPTSQMLDFSAVDQRYHEVVRHILKILQDHKSLQDIIVLFDIDELSEKDELTVVRVCNVKRFLSKSLFVAEMFTGIPGRFVDLETTIPDIDEVLSGKLMTLLRSLSTWWVIGWTQTLIDTCAWTSGKFWWGVVRTDEEKS